MRLPVVSHRRPTRPGLTRGVRATVLSAAVATAAAALGSAPASASPEDTHETAEEAVDRLYTEAERATERYNGALEDLGRAARADRPGPGRGGPDAGGRQPAAGVPRFDGGRAVPLRRHRPRGRPPALLGPGHLPGPGRRTGPRGRAPGRDAEQAAACPAQDRPEPRGGRRGPRRHGTGPRGGGPAQAHRGGQAGPGEAAAARAAGHRAAGPRPRLALRVTGDAHRGRPRLRARPGGPPGGPAGSGTPVRVGQPAVPPDSTAPG